MNGIVNGIMHRGGYFHNLQTGKNGNFLQKKPPVHKKKLTSRVLTRPPQNLN